jgi:hypothetical protein
MIYDILGYISETTIYSIKLDIVAHMIIGTFIFCMASKKYSVRRSFIILLTLTLAKEIHDQGVSTNTFVENIKDIFFSLIVPTGLIYFRDFSNKFNIREKRFKLFFIK